MWSSLPMAPPTSECISTPFHRHGCIFFQFRVQKTWKRSCLVSRSLVCLNFWMLIDLRTMNFLYPKYYDWLSIFHSFILFTCVKMWQISWFCTIVKMFPFFVVVIALNKLWFQDFIIQLDILQWQPIIILHEITLIKN